MSNREREKLLIDSLDDEKIFYVVRFIESINVDKKKYDVKQAAYDEIEALLESHPDIEPTFDEKKAKEEYMNEKYECAKACHADYIITRNIKDFSGSEIPCITAEQLLNLY